MGRFPPPPQDMHELEVRLDCLGPRSGTHSRENVLREVAKASSLWHFTIYIPEAGEPATASHVDIFFVQVLAEKKESCHFSEAAELYMDLRRSILDHLSSEEILYMIAMSPLRTSETFPELQPFAIMVGQCRPWSAPKRIPPRHSSVVEAISEGATLTTATVSSLLQNAAFSDAASNLPSATVALVHKMASSLTRATEPSERDSLIKSCQQAYKELEQKSQDGWEEFRLALAALVQKEKALQGSANHGQLPTPDVLFVLSKLTAAAKTNQLKNLILVDLIPALEEENTTSKVVTWGLISVSALAYTALCLASFIYPEAAAVLGQAGLAMATFTAPLAVQAANTSATTWAKQNQTKEVFNRYDRERRSADEMAKWLVFSLMSSLGFPKLSEDQKMDMLRLWGIHADLHSHEEYQTGGALAAWELLPKEDQKSAEEKENVTR